MMIRSATALLAFFSIVWMPGFAAAQNRSTQTAATTEPAERFQSVAAGISFQPPPGMKQFRGVLGSSEVVRYVDEDRKWILKVRRVLLDRDQGQALETHPDKDGRPIQGFFDRTVEQFKLDNSSAAVLRQDVNTIGRFSVGILDARYTVGADTTLAQLGILQASNFQYYIFALNTPVPRQGDMESDPGINAAVAAFRVVLESVSQVDQSMVKEEQEDRLYKTRSLMMSFSSPGIGKALVKEQWLRVIRDGKDVGYTYVVEEIGRDLPRKGQPESQTGPQGLLIGARSRLLPEAGGKIDTESWAFCAFDRKHESWSSISMTQDPKLGVTRSGELGTARWRERPVALKPEIGRPSAMLGEEYRLEVTQLGRGMSSEPIVRDLPPYYLPQAYGQVLTRIVPRDEPKGYLFATWVSDARQLMYRYFDVGYEQEVSFAGKKMRAIPMKDRIGLEGAVTTHYISPEGAYLGSENLVSKIMLVPSDGSTLEKLWHDTKISRPNEVDPAAAISQ